MTTHGHQPSSPDHGSDAHQHEHDEHEHPHVDDAGHPHDDHAGHSHGADAGHSHDEHAGHPDGDDARHPNDDHAGHSHEEHTGHSHGDDAGHSHGGDDGHSHGPSGALGRLLAFFPFVHSHQHEVSPDDTMRSTEEGIRAVKLSLVLLGITAIFQVAVVIASGSVALFADTIHNFTDAMTALPLWLAFSLSRRPVSRRYTYGLGRVEDLAGVFIVLMILISAIVAGYESFRRIADPQELQNIGWVIAAAIIGFIGNEIVAVLRIRTGERIGSAALVADGHHARVDGLTSLAVLGGAIGVMAGAPIADPIVGMLITVAILFILKDAIIAIAYRLLDAVDPELVRRLEHTAEHAIEGKEGIRSIGDLRVRWLGHKLLTELSLTVDESLSTRQSHDYAEDVRHALFHASPQVATVIVHVEPDGEDGEDPHRLTAHHR